MDKTFRNHFIEYLADSENGGTLEMNLGYIKSEEKDLLLLKPEAQKEIVYLPLIKRWKEYQK